MLICYVLLGLDWAKAMIFFLVCMSHVHAYIPSFFYILIYWCVWCFSTCLSFFRLVASWHLNENPLHPKSLFVLGYLLLLTLHLLMYSSVMIKPKRTFRGTFVGEAFIRNAKSSYWIFLILTYPLSFTVGVGGHYVTSRSLVPPWSYRSFTPICMESILLYLISFLAFEVHA